MNKLLILLLSLVALCVEAQPYMTSGTVVRTNFISAQLYTNNYKVPIHVSFTVTNVQGAVAGTTRFDLWVFKQGGAADVRGVTNFAGAQTLGTSLATTNCAGVLSAWVPVGFVWTPTNQSASAGTVNAAGPFGGQIFIPKP